MNFNQSKIEKLIARLCPDGVEFIPLWKVTDWDKRFNGVKKEKQSKVLSFKHVSAKNLKDLAVKNGNVKLLATGKFNGWTTEKAAGTNVNDGEVITIPSGGSANIKYYKGKFVDSGNILAKSFNDKVLNLKYCYYFLLSKNDLIENYFRGPGVKHPSMTEILEIRVPLPPFAVQEEIVRILDSYTELESELESELEARKQQYEYYRDLFINSENRKDTKYIPLKDVAQDSFWIMPATPKFIDEKEIPYITSKDIRNGHVNFSNVKYISHDDYLNISKNRPIQKNDILISMIGTIGEVAKVRESDLDFYGQNMFLVRLNPKLINVDYFLHFFDSAGMKQYFSSIKHNSGQGYLKSEHIDSIKIPIPSPEEQKRIVSILGKFNSLVNDISIGLPAELSARRSQYEYYRDKLLTFDEYVY